MAGSDYLQSGIFSVIYLTQVLYDDYIKKFKNLTYEEKVIHSVYTQMNQIDIFQMKRYMVNTKKKIRILKYK